MKEPKFKNGDKIRPIEGKKSSNGYTITKIKEITVAHAYYSTSNGRILLRGKITKGLLHGYSAEYSQKYAYDFFEDAFELVDNTEDYEIY